MSWKAQPGWPFLSVHLSALATIASIVQGGASVVRRASEVVVSAQPIFDYVDALVHASVRGDSLAAARHRAFIAPRLAASIVALALFPIFIVASGAPGTIEALILGWLTAPLFAACILSRTGRLDFAQQFSTVCVTGLGAAIAAAAGGIGSFAAVWLVLVPLEAAFAGKPRPVIFACALTLTAGAALIVAQTQHLLPTPPSASAGLTVVGLLSAALYAAALAFGAQVLAGATDDAMRAKDDRYQLLSRQMSDSVTRHGRNGAILYASPATAALFKASIGDLLGGGLLDRIHAADRQSYLATLADASEFGHERSVELRILRETSAARLSEVAWVEMRCERLGTMQPPSRPEVVAVMRDITLQKQQAAVIESLRAAIDEANAASCGLLSLLGREQAQKIRPIAAGTDTKVRSSA